MITNEMMREWLKEYKELESIYRTYLNFADQSTDYETEDRWDSNATQIRYRMRGMIKCLNIFGYDYDGTRISKISSDVTMKE